MRHCTRQDDPGPVPVRAGAGPFAFGGEHEGGAGTETSTATAEETALAPPWNVIVHDDPITLMDYVVRTLRQVFGFAQERAHRHMMEVHTTGRSIVWTGAREQAEMYVAKLHGHLLLATMEKVPG